MTCPCSVRLLGRALLLLGALAFTGCWFQGHSRLDEEKEPHYLAGKNRQSEMDYPGAIESFQRALEVNPSSSAAHFELGLLYEKHNYAAAVYHFERFLDLRPKSDYADVVKLRILACKQELAKTVSLGPVTQALQTELERLTEDNKRLREEIEALRAYYARPQTSAAPVVAARSSPAAQAPAATAAGAAAKPASHPAAATRLHAGRTEAMAAPVARRTHTIQSGETLIAIARRYGLKVESLMAANPSLDARRLQVGRSLNVPLP